MLALLELLPPNDMWWLWDRTPSRSSPTKSMRVVGGKAAVELAPRLAKLAQSAGHRRHASAAVASWADEQYVASKGMPAGEKGVVTTTAGRDVHEIARMPSGSESSVVDHAEER